METEPRETVGVDIVDTRYVMCILDSRGMDPRYYRGRVDTPLGQANFFSKVGGRDVIMPSSSLAVLAMKLLKESQLVVKDEDEHYAVWADAGIERGERMARFAALLLYRNHHPSDSINDKQRQQLILLQDAELASLLSVVQTSQTIIQDVLSGKTDGKTYAKALGNEVKSRQDPVIKAEIQKEHRASPFADGDSSFLAKLYRELEDLQ